MQPAFTTYKHCHSTFTSNPTSINSDATCIHYVQALPQHVHKQSNKYQLRCNLHSLCTTSGKARSQSIPSVYSLKQAGFTMYNHWQRSFTIYSVSHNSETTLMNYLQALALHVYNQADHYQLRCNLDSLCASSGTTPSQSIRAALSVKHPRLTMYKQW